MSPRFLWLTLAASFNFCAFFLYIVSAPVFLGEHLGLGPQEYAWLFLPGILGIMTGSQLSGRAAGRLTPRATVKRAYAFMIVAAVGNLAYALAGPPSVPWAILPILVYGIGMAMAMPSISLLNLDLFPTRRGMAASLQGFISGMANALVAGVVSPALSSTPQGLALGMVATMVLGLACWLMYLRSVRHHGAPLLPGPEL